MMVNADLQENVHIYYSKGLILKLIIPVWIESFVNLVIFLLAKPSLRSRIKAFKSYKKSPVLERIKLLHKNCRGFSQGIDPEEKVIKEIAEIFRVRNRVLHGGIDPNLIPSGKIYFDEKYIPLVNKNTYVTQFLQDLLFHEVALSKLDEQISTGEKFISYVFDLLKTVERDLLLRMMAESIPGWDEKRSIAGCILPSQFIDSFLQIAEQEKESA
jgi:hypothetical protein